MTVSAAEQIQLLFEILMSVDSHADIKVSAKKSLSLILRKLNCSAGGIFFVNLLSDESDVVKEIISIPQISINSFYLDSLETFTDKIRKTGWVDLQKSFPFCYNHENEGYCHILNLSDFGFILLIKNNGCFPDSFIKSLQPVFNKIGSIYNSMLKNETLLLNEERLRSIYENVNIGLFRISSAGNILMLNPAGRKILGINNESDIGEMIITDFYKDPSFRDELVDALEKQKNIKGIRTHWKKKSGEFFPVNINVTAYYDESGKIRHFEGSFEDITERENFENNLKAAKENAEKSEKLKSDFLAQMSHEIRTPVNTILNYTSLLTIDENAGRDQQNAFIYDSIENAVNRLLRTIDLVLNMSDIENNTYKAIFEEVHFERDVLKPIIQEFNSAADKKKLKLELTSTDTSQIVYADKYTLIQIVVNLLDNAIKYTHKGKITLSIKDNIFSISDTGIGISEEYIPQLFQKFSQEETGYSRKFEGTGLGLSLVKKYCEINNAEISVESKKGIGTTFKVIFKQKSPFINEYKKQVLQ